MMASKKWISITIILVVAFLISGWLFWKYNAYLINVMKDYGYAGIFLISLIGSSTIIFPLPVSAFVFAAPRILNLNPFLIALSAALGCTIGEFVGYALGSGSRKAVEDKWKKWIKRTEKLFQRYGGFLIIVVFAATPLPDDIVGIVSGAIKYPLKKFFIASFIGKLILNLVLAYGGYYGLDWILKYLGI